MTAPSLLTKFFAVCSLSVGQTAPARALDPDRGSQAIWRDTLNFHVRDNRLIRRPGLVALTAAAQPPWQMNASLTESDAVLWVASIFGPSNSDVLVVITARHAFIRDTAGTWTNVTPTYITGTLTATNGSATITGAGTAWSTRGITASQWIKIDGVNYKLTAVTTDVDATIDPVFGGATAAGKTYTIFRSFAIGFVPSEFGATIFNENLYLAGSRLGAGSNFTRTAVIKVSNILTAGISPGTYLTGNFNYTGTLDVVTDLSRIVGVKVLQDGRVVVAANNSGVVYSSHLNDAVWTVSPGGQTLLTNTSGRLSALGELNGILTFHSPGSVILGQPTGAADPPLRFTRSAATHGCYAPRTLVNAGSEEWYVSCDLEIESFDLSRNVVRSSGELRVADNSVDGWSTLARTTVRDSLFAGVNISQHQYWVGQTGSSLSSTFCFDMKSGSAWETQWSIPVTAIALLNERSLSVPGGPTTATPSGPDELLVGVNGLDGSTEKTNLLYEMKADGAAGETKYSGFSDGGFLLETDSLDFGKPLALKTLQRVIVWVRRMKSNSARTLTISGSADDGANWTSYTVTLPSGSNLATVVPFQVWFDELDKPGPSRAPRVRLSFAADSAVDWEIVQLMIIAIEGASIEGTEL